MVRRTVCFGEAVYEGQTTVEDIVARRVPDVAGVAPFGPNCDPCLGRSRDAPCRASLPQQSWSTGSWRSATPGSPRRCAGVIGLDRASRPELTATPPSRRSAGIGRAGSTGRGRRYPTPAHPARSAGRSWPVASLRAPTDGILPAHVVIGDRVTTGQIIATVAGSERLAGGELRAGCDGVLRGLIRSGAACSSRRQGRRHRPAPARTRLLLHHLRQIAGGRRWRAGSDSGKLMDWAIAGTISVSFIRQPGWNESNDENSRSDLSKGQNAS